MHFATFLKLLSQDAGEKIKDLEKYATPGGFDFWRPLREGVGRHVAHGQNSDSVKQFIEQSAANNAVNRNVEVFTSVSEWVARQSGVGFLPNRGVWKSPNGVFSIHIEPEIGLEKRNGEKHITAIYGRTTPRLNRDKAGAAIILLEKSYRGDGSETFGILDAGKPQLIRAKTNVSERLLEVEISFIEDELHRILG